MEAISTPGTAASSRENPRRTGFSQGGDEHGGAIGQRALRLADPAPDAEIFVDVRLLEHSPFAPRRLCPFLLEDDRLACGRAMLLADDAVRLSLPWEATAPVDVGEAQFRLPLLREGEAPDRAGRADLSAEGAIEFAISYPRHEDRAPHPFEPRLEPGRLQAVRDADPHAFPAPGAAGEDLPLRQRAWGPDQQRVPRLPVRLHPEEGNRDRAERGRSENTTTCEIDNRRLAPLLPGEVDHLRGTDRLAIHALDTFAMVGHGDVTPDRPHAAVRFAKAAAGAPRLRDPPAEEPVPSHERQQCPERTQVPAPEPPLVPLHGEDAEEEEPHERGGPEDRLLEGEEVGLEEAVDRFRNRGDRPGRPVETVEDPVEHEVQRGEDGDGERPDEDADRVEKEYPLKREQRGGGEEEEDEELVPPPGYGHRVLPSGLPEHRRVRGIDYGAERAEPSAEEAAQHDREERDDQRGPDQPDERSPRKGGGPRHQGIEPEKEVDRVRENIVVLVLRVQEEENEEKEHHPLRDAPKRPRRLHPKSPALARIIAAGCT